MPILPAAPPDVDEATRCLTAAFAADPLITFFFRSSPPGRDAACHAFFSLLMRARLALGMPVLLAKEGDAIAGAAMGYSTERLDWPEPVQREWDAFEHVHPGLTDRFAVMEQISERGHPQEPHYYLGVLGVRPDRHGKGFGGMLLEAFCGLSANDPRSCGVYLETAAPANLPYYERYGFARTAEGALDDTATLWCLFRQDDRSSAGG